INRRSLLAGMGAAAMATGLAACGGSGGGNNDGGAGDGEGGSGGGGGAGVEITYMFRGGEDERKAYDQAIAEFEKQTGAKVRVIVTDADQYRTKLQAAITGNQVPDVFYLEQGSVMAFARSGVVKDITAD